MGSPFRSAGLLGLGSSPGISPCQFLSPRGPDGLRATSQLVGRRNVGNRAFPTFTLLSAASGVFCLEGQRTMRMGSTSTTSIHKNKELNA